MCSSIVIAVSLSEWSSLNRYEAFSEDELAEIRIVLDQLGTLVNEDEYLDEATREKLDQLAQALRENDEGFHVPEHDPHRDYVAEMHILISGPDAR